MVQRIQEFVRHNVSSLRQKGSFTRNFAITLSGSALTTILGILLTPIVSRIYPPAAYGQFSVYASLISNLNLVTTLSYPGAFLLPKERSKFFNLVQLTLLVTCFSCLLLSAVLALAGPFIMTRLDVKPLGAWFYTIPVMLLIFNVNTVLNSWYLRDKQFAKRVGVDIVSNLGSRAFTIGYGLLSGANVAGLLLGEFFNRIVNTVSLLAGGVWRELRTLWRDFSWQKVREVAYEYRAFPLFNLPAGYVYVASTQLPIFMLAPAFGSTAVGLYAFSMSLLEMPINLIASAIAPVFQQKAVETHQEAPERLAGITLSLYDKLLYVGLLPFGIITVYGDIIFKVFFGAKWEMAGVFTGYLGYYYVFKLLSLGTAGIYYALGKQNAAFYANLLLLVMRALGLGIGVYLHDLNLTLLLFGIGSLVATFAADLYVLSLLKLPIVRIAIRTLILVGVTLVLIKLSRVGLAHYFAFFA